MTIEELDNALTKLHLDLTTPSGIEIRNRILERHGKELVSSKRFRCENCWIKSNRGKCSESCQMYGMPDDPIEASKKYLSSPNNIYLFSFLCLYVIPVYEEVTGNRDTMGKMSSEFKKLWARRQRRNGKNQ